MRNYSMILSLTKGTIANQLEFQECMRTAHQLSTSEQYALGLTIDEVKAGSKTLEDGEYTIAFIRGTVEDTTLLPTAQEGLGKVLHSWITSYTQTENPTYKVLGLQINDIVIVDEVADFVKLEGSTKPKEIWDYDTNYPEMIDNYWTVEIFANSLELVGAMAEDGVLFEVLGAVAESAASAGEALAPIAEMSGEALGIVGELIGPILEVGGELIGGLFEIIAGVLGGL
jgi:hypothetical protein